MSKGVLAREIAHYERLQQEFEKEHHWEWVVIHGEEVVGFFDDFQVAADVAVRRYGRGPYLIRRVGAPKYSLPFSVLYQPVYADS